MSLISAILSHPPKKRRYWLMKQLKQIDCKSLSRPLTLCRRRRCRWDSAPHQWRTLREWQTAPWACRRPVRHAESEGRTPTRPAPWFREPPHLCWMDVVEIRHRGCQYSCRQQWGKCHLSTSCLMAIKDRVTPYATSNANALLWRSIVPHNMWYTSY